MAVAHGYPSGRTATGALIETRYHLPHNPNIIIDFYKSQSYHSLSTSFRFSLSHRGDPTGPFASYEFTPGTFSRFEENIREAKSKTMENEIMKARAEVLSYLYDKLRLSLCVTNDHVLKQFFFDSGYKALFLQYDCMPSRWPPAPVKQPEPLKDPQLESAKNITQFSMNSQKRTVEDMTKLKRMVNEHYKKYGTLGQKLLAYLKSLYQ